MSTNTNPTPENDTASQAVIVDPDAISMETSFLIDPHLLTIDYSRNGRFSEPDQKKIKELASSFATNGQLQNICVKEDASGSLTVIYGFHRALAGVWGMDNGILPSDFKIRYDLAQPDADDMSVFLTNVAENAERSELTVMDEAYIYNRLTTEFSMSSKEASEKLGHKKNWGNAVSKLLSLPRNIQKLIHLGRISGEAGYEVAMAGEEGVKVMIGLIAKVEGGAVLLPVWREAWRKHAEANRAENEAAVSAGGLEETTAQDDNISDDGGTGKKKKKKAGKKAGSGEVVLKRTAADLKRFLTETIEGLEVKDSTGQDGKGTVAYKVAKKLLDYTAGKGSDASFKKFLLSLG
jgi:ParB/RepB/Spo0J family partition protein